MASPTSHAHNPGRPYIPSWLFGLCLGVFAAGVAILITTAIAGANAMCESPSHECDGTTLIDKILGQERIVVYDPDRSKFVQTFLFKNDLLEPYDGENSRHYWSSPLFVLLFGLTITGLSGYMLVRAFQVAFKQNEERQRHNAASPPPSA